MSKLLQWRADNPYYSKAPTANVLAKIYRDHYADQMDWEQFVQEPEIQQEAGQDEKWWNEKVRPKHGVIKEAGYGVARGVVGSVASVMQGGQAIKDMVAGEEDRATTEGTAYKMGEGMQEWAQQAFPASRETFMTRVWEGVGSMLTFIGPGAVGRMGAGALGRTALGLRGVTTAEQGAKRIRTLQQIGGYSTAVPQAAVSGMGEAYNRALGNDMTEEERRAHALKYGPLAGAVQVANLGIFFKALPKDSKASAYRIIAGRMAEAGISEFTVENLGAIIQNLGQRVYSPDHPLWAEVPETGMTAGTAAVIIQAMMLPFIGRRSANTRVRAKGTQENLEQLPNELTSADGDFQTVEEAQNFAVENDIRGYTPVQNEDGGFTLHKMVQTEQDQDAILGQILHNVEDGSYTAEDVATSKEYLIGGLGISADKVDQAVVRAQEIQEARTPSQDELTSNIHEEAAWQPSEADLALAGAETLPPSEQAELEAAAPRQQATPSTLVAPVPPAETSTPGDSSPGLTLGAQAPDVSSAVAPTQAEHQTQPTKLENPRQLEIVKNFEQAAVNPELSAVALDRLYDQTVAAVDNLGLTEAEAKLVDDALAEIYGLADAKLEDAQAAQENQEVIDWAALDGKIEGNADLYKAAKNRPLSIWSGLPARQNKIDEAKQALAEQLKANKTPHGPIQVVKDTKGRARVFAELDRAPAPKQKPIASAPKKAPKLNQTQMNELSDILEAPPETQDVPAQPAKIRPLSQAAPTRDPATNKQLREAWDQYVAKMDAFAAKNKYTTRQAADAARVVLKNNLDSGKVTEEKGADQASDIKQWQDLREGRIQPDDVLTRSRGALGVRKSLQSEKAKKATHAAQRKWRSVTHGAEVRDTVKALLTGPIYNQTGPSQLKLLPLIDTLTNQLVIDRMKSGRMVENEQALLDTDDPGAEAGARSQAASAATAVQWRRNQTAQELRAEMEADDVGSVLVREMEMEAVEQLQDLVVELEAGLVNQDIVRQRGRKKDDPSDAKLEAWREQNQKKGRKKDKPLPKKLAAIKEAWQFYVLKKHHNAILDVLTAEQEAQLWDYIDNRVQQTERRRIMDMLQAEQAKELLDTAAARTQSALDEGAVVLAGLDRLAAVPGWSKLPVVKFPEAPELPAGMPQAKVKREQYYKWSQEIETKRDAYKEAWLKKEGEKLDKMRDSSAEGEVSDAFTKLDERFDAVWAEHKENLMAGRLQRENQKMQKSFQDRFNAWISRYPVNRSRAAQYAAEEAQYRQEVKAAWKAVAEGKARLNYITEGKIRQHLAYYNLDVGNRAEWNLDGRGMVSLTSATGVLFSDKTTFSEFAAAYRQSAAQLAQQQVASKELAQTVGQPEAKRQGLLKRWEQARDRRRQAAKEDYARYLADKLAWEKGALAKPWAKLHGQLGWEAEAALGANVGLVQQLSEQVESHRGTAASMIDIWSKAQFTGRGMFKHRQVQLLLNTLKRRFGKQLGEIKVREWRPDLPHLMNAPQTRSHYNHDSNTIYLSAQGETSLYVFTHELVHALTASWVRNEGWNHPYVKELTKIYNEARAKAQAQGLAKDLYPFFQKIQDKPGSGVLEMMAEVMVNSELQAFLNGIQSSAPRQTLWTRFLNMVQQILGLKSGTTLHDVVSLTNSIMETANPFSPPAASRVAGTGGAVTTTGRKTTQDTGPSKTDLSLARAKEAGVKTLDMTGKAGAVPKNIVTTMEAGLASAALKSRAAAAQAAATNKDAAAPGNISSNSKALLGALTNPTVLAKKKGNIQQDYPVTFRGKTYPDSEAAYKAHQDGRGPTAANVALMVEVITAKLQQHPRMVAAIEASGGMAFLQKSSHQVTGKSTWEGVGMKSPFIQALVAAYQQVATTTQKAAPTIQIVQQGFGKAVPADVIDGHRYQGKYDITNTKPGDRGALGNPYKANDTIGGKHLPDRAAASAMFKETFLKRVANDPAYRDWILSLRGKKIGYYKPAEPNHLQVVQEWLAAQPVAAPAAPAGGVTAVPKSKPALPETGNRYLDKDKLKWRKANKFIGRGSPQSSTQKYADALGPEYANTGQYTAKNQVFISAEGNRSGRLAPDQVEIRKALAAGATIITDDAANRERPYNTGEREVASLLTESGYKEIKPGVWRKVDNILEAPPESTIPDHGLYKQTKAETTAIEQEAAVRLQKMKPVLDAAIMGRANKSYSQEALNKAQSAMPEIERNNVLHQRRNAWAVTESRGIIGHIAKMKPYKELSAWLKGMHVSQSWSLTTPAIINVWTRFNKAASEKIKSYFTQQAHTAVTAQMKSSRARQDKLKEYMAERGKTLDGIKDTDVQYRWKGQEVSMPAIEAMYHHVAWENTKHRKILMKEQSQFDSRLSDKQAWQLYPQPQSGVLRNITAFHELMAQQGLLEKAPNGKFVLTEKGQDALVEMEVGEDGNHYFRWPESMITGERQIDTLRAQLPKELQEIAEYMQKDMEARFEAVAKVWSSVEKVIVDRLSNKLGVDGRQLLKDMYAKHEFFTQEKNFLPAMSVGGNVNVDVMADLMDVLGNRRPLKEIMETRKWFLNDPGSVHYANVQKNLYTIWSETVSAQEHFIHMTNPVMDMYLLYTVRDPHAETEAGKMSMREVVTKYYGDQMSESFDNWLLSLAKPRSWQRNDLLGRAMREVRRRSVLAYLGANIVTVGKQASSLWYAVGTHAPAEYFMRTLQQGLTSTGRQEITDLVNKEIQMELRQMEEVVEDFSVEQFKRHMTDPIYRALGLNPYSARKKFVRSMMYGIKKIDRATVFTIYHSVYKYHMDVQTSADGANMSAEGLAIMESKARMKALEAVLETQDSSHGKDVSRIYRYSDAVSMLTLFTSQVSKIWVKASNDVVYKGLVLGKRDRDFYWDAAMLGLAATITGMMSKGFSMDDEDPETGKVAEWKNMVIGEGISYTPLFGGALKMVYEGMPASAGTAMTVPVKSAQAFRNLVGTARGEKEFISVMQNLTEAVLMPGHIQAWRTHRAFFGDKPTDNFWGIINRKRQFNELEDLKPLVAAYKSQKRIDQGDIQVRQAMRQIDQLQRVKDRSRDPAERKRLEREIKKLRQDWVPSYRMHNQLGGLVRTRGWNPEEFRRLVARTPAE